MCRAVQYIRPSVFSMLFRFKLSCNSTLLKLVIRVPIIYQCEVWAARQASRAASSIIPSPLLSLPVVTLPCRHLHPFLLGAVPLL